ncbi:MAG: hypothetical protein HY093_03780 [Candidatus Liptonbacteria bacterium]|nr:hypothetical protein [Candidatus Liptonbacteria bacterium]
MRAFLDQLESALTSEYIPPKVFGGHDFTHVKQLISLAKDRIHRVVSFDMDEFEAAAWLHNLDRASGFRDRVKAVGLESVCLSFLDKSPFEREARKRITKAVLEHSKKDDEPGDSTLLVALRIADKIDRFSPSGILAIAAHSGMSYAAYDPKFPFGYTSTEEHKLKSTYNNFMRVLERYDMLPSDEARELLDPADLDFFITFLREFGEEIAFHTGAEDRTEGDIKKALGTRYAEVLALISERTEQP